MMLTKILKNNNNIIFAVLFGSYANDTSYNLSDIDIAIYTNKELDILEIGSIVSDLEQATNKKIDLIVLNNLYKTYGKI